MTKELIDQIEKTIAEVEKICSLEIVAVFARRSSWLSKLFPRKKQLVIVEDAAHRQFIKHKIYETADRTGVLIYVSESEKAVYLVADEGVLKVIPAKEWADLGAKLASFFATESADKTFLEALKLLANRVAPSFPPKAQNPDELSNRVRIEN